MTARPVHRRFAETAARFPDRIAVERGFFEKEGLRVRYVQFQGTNLMLSALMANELDYVTILPFIAGAGWTIAVQSCLMLGAANLIYYLRAKTEERHLAADPVYRAYQDYIATHGLFARLFGSLRKSSAVAET